MKNLHLILNLIQVTWTLAINPSSLEHNCKQQKINYLWIQFIFSCKSHSTIANVCPSVHLSVWGQNPSTAWNHHPSLFIFHPSSFFNHPSSFFIHPSFISRLLSFSSCFIVTWAMVSCAWELEAAWAFTGFGKSAPNLEISISTLKM